MSTEDLVAQLDVSPETIRRDLLSLERQGSLVRVHGGATRAGSSPVEPSFVERAALHSDHKDHIAQLAATLVESGQTLVLDVGTTAVAVARAIAPSFRGTVVTCSLLVAAELAGRSGLEVIVAGGRLRAGDLACSSAQTVRVFGDLRADIAFLSSGGVDADVGLTDYHLDEVATRRVILANSMRSYVLADSSKIGQVAPHRVCDLAATTGVLTDSSARPHDVVCLQRIGVDVLVAGRGGSGVSALPSQPTRMGTT